MTRTFIWSRALNGRFPEIKELKQLVRESRLTLFWHGQQRDHFVAVKLRTDETFEIGLNAGTAAS